MAYETKVKIVLHGYLKKLIPEGLFMTGYSAGEIVNGFFRQFPHLGPSPGKNRMAVQVQGFETKESLFAALTPDVKELHICPMLAGGKGGFGQIILGIVIIGTAFMTGGASLVAGNLVFSSTLAGMFFNLGVSLVLGGLLGMLSPSPKLTQSDSTRDPAASQYLGATQNTVKIGTRIPLLWGKFRCYGHYLSFDVDAKDVDL